MTPLRIQRMLPRLQMYDIELQFVQVNTISVPETFSRASLPVVEESKFNYQVHPLLSSPPVSNRKLNEMRPASEEDKVLQNVKEYVKNGWPENKLALPTDVVRYFSV